MESLGIRCGEQDWFKGYLKNRIQVVKANNTISGEQMVQCGVPQGSTLGPLLFLIYINDMIDYIGEGVLLFADDTVLYSSDQNYQKATKKLQEKVNTVSYWTRYSELTVNNSKSKTMTIRPNRKPIEGGTIYMERVGLEEVVAYKYLGLITDNELSFKPHVKMGSSYSKPTRKVEENAHRVCSKKCL